MFGTSLSHLGLCNKQREVSYSKYLTEFMKDISSFKQANFLQTVEYVELLANI